MPEWKQEIRQRLAGVKLEPAREAAIFEELAQYLEDYYAELLAGGATEAEAYQCTLTELSGSELLACELRRMERQNNSEPVVLGTNWRTNMIADLWQDFRFGARMLAKKPGFNLIAVVTLALGIGANTAIFSVVNALLLRPLPYAEAERLVLLAETSPGTPRNSASYPNYEDWRARAQSFEGMAMAWPQNFTLTGDDNAARVAGYSLNWNS